MVKHKQMWGRVIFITALLLIGYFLTRLPNLTKLPIFTDEAIYIRWSQIGAQDANWRFISLTDGKQPMFTWITMMLLRFVHLDPLFVGRLTSVIAGFGSLIGISFLTFVLFESIPLCIIAALLYLIFPFSMWYDRMALYDSLVSMFYILSLALSILLVKKQRLDISLLLGMSLGLGMLNKTSGFLSLYLLPATLVLFDFKSKNRRQRLVRWLMLAIVSAILSQLIYSILRLSPFFYIIAQKNTIFVYPLREWLLHPFRFLIGNLRGLFDWCIHYISWPLFLASFAPFIVVNRRLKEKILLVFFWIVPLVGLALFGRVLYPRFILFMTMPLLVLMSLTFFHILRIVSSGWQKALLIVLLILPSIYTDFFIVSNPIIAPIPKSDRGQFIEDWPAGGGIKEVVNYFSKEAQKGKISVYTDGTFGLFPYALEIYLVENSNVKIKGFYPVPAIMPFELTKEAMDHETFVIFNEHETPTIGWPISLIAEYPKGTNSSKTLRLYRVIPPVAYKGI